MTSKTLEIIAAVRATTKTRTDYAVAKALGMPQGNLKRILGGYGWLGMKSALRAAQALGRPMEEIVADMELDKLTTPKQSRTAQLGLPLPHRSGHKGGNGHAVRLRPQRPGRSAKGKRRPR
jgi:hypothetical protein